MQQDSLKRRVLQFSRTVSSTSVLTTRDHHETRDVISQHRVHICPIDMRKIIHIILERVYISLWCPFALTYSATSTAPFCVISRAKNGVVCAWLSAFFAIFAYQLTSWLKASGAKSTFCKFTSLTAKFQGRLTWSSDMNYSLETNLILNLGSRRHRWRKLQKRWRRLMTSWNMWVRSSCHRCNVYRKP